jgi:hypothetical protein
MPSQSKGRKKKEQASTKGAELATTGSDITVYVKEVLKICVQVSAQTHPIQSSVTQIISLLK